MKTDIYQKIKNDFGIDSKRVQDEISNLETRTKGLIGDQILRSMVFLAQGDVEKFIDLMELSRLNYKQVIRQAEYNNSDKRVYDFNQSFHQLKLVKR